MVDEVVDFSKRNRNECLIIKVHFEKANDLVSWINFF